VLTGLIWLSTGPSDGLLWSRWWFFVFHRRRRKFFIPKVRPPIHGRALESHPAD